MSASLDDVVLTLKSGNQISSGILQAISGLGPFLQTVLGASFTFGTFTCSANTNTTVADASVTANSMIVWVPTNATGGTLEGSTRKLYLSLRSAGTSFRVTTASGVAAAGTETFSYVIINPA